MCWYFTFLPKTFVLDLFQLFLSCWDLHGDTEEESEVESNSLNLTICFFPFFQIEIGLVLGNSQVAFEKAENSSLNLIGKCIFIQRDKYCLYCLKFAAFQASRTCIPKVCFFLLYELT